MSESAALIYLTAAATGFAEQVRAGGWAPDGSPQDVEGYVGAREFLTTTALAYAADAGSLDAAERAELAALRRFRDGVAAALAEPPELIVETIKAFFAISYPKVEPS